MKRFVEEADRGQWTLLPECLDDFIDESNPVRVIDVFVDALDLAEMSFEGVEPAATGRPSYHPSVLLKLYIYGYLNRVQSSRRLEREAGRNVEVMWLLGRLAPDHKTIADFRKDNGLALRKVCARFVELCREMGLLATASVAIDGSKFKAVNNRDKNFTRAKVERRRAQLEEGVARYLSQLDAADRQEPTEALAAKVTRLTEKLTKLKEETGKLAVYEKQMLASPDQQISLTDPDSRSMATSGRGSGVVGYNVQVAVDTGHHLIIAHEVTNTGLAHGSESCRQLMTVPGIGPLIARAMVAAIGNGAGFAKGRDFAAWLGLVPKQMSTGDRTILGRISKRGNRYLRTLLMQGARVILLRPANWARHSFGPWLTAAANRLHHNVLATALANKLARIAWTVLVQARSYEARV
jgi:transposase